MGAYNLPLVFLNCDRGNSLEIGLLWAGKGAKALFGTFANSVGLVVLVRCSARSYALPGGSGWLKRGEGGGSLASLLLLEAVHG